MRGGVDTGKNRPMTEQESWMDSGAVLEQIVKADSVFILESKNIFMMCIVFSSTRQHKNLPTIGACTESTDLIVKALKKYAPDDPVPFSSKECRAWSFRRNPTQLSPLSGVAIHASQATL